jgi:3-deoxy-manno-octulosonate cytidylyltransferase (CMP-KDO synthetase)
MKPVIIVPARKESSRLANKMLALIGNIPMICHTAARAVEANIAPVYVATDNKEIKEICESYSHTAIMTDISHQSGTDRIYEALLEVDPQKEFDLIINLQGDVPFIPPKLIKELIEKAKESKADILTLASKLTEPERASDPSVVTVAIAFYDQDKIFGKALYFSRQAIPYNAKQFYEHIGVYLYRRDALEKYVKITDSNLEKAEKLEQLRALENHMHIDVLITEEAPITIDTQEGLERARKFHNHNFKNKKA